MIAIVDLNPHTNGMEEMGTRGRLQLPWDVSELTPRATLREWVEEEVGSLDWNNPEMQKYLKANPKARPQAMLNLLTFCYLTGMFDSEEIVIACYKEPDMRAIYLSFDPTVQSIRRFRRENRGLLKWSMVQVLKRVIHAQYPDQAMPILAGLRRWLLDSATERLDLARHMEGAQSH